MKHYLIISVLLLLHLGLYGQGISKKELKYKPVNLDEAVLQLIKILPDTTQQSFFSMDENEFFMNTHMGLGLWIRNNWGLWKGGKLANYFKSKKIFHPDNMSGIILRCYYRQLHNQDWELDEQIKVYQDAWELSQEHFRKLKTDAAYQKRVQFVQDSMKIEYLNYKKTLWKIGTVISVNLSYQCGLINFGESIKVKGIIIGWQNESVVVKITQYFDESKKKRVIKCNNIKDDIVIIHNHEKLRQEE